MFSGGLKPEKKFPVFFCFDLSPERGGRGHLSDTELIYKVTHTDALSLRLNVACVASMKSISQHIVSPFSNYFLKHRPLNARPMSLVSAPPFPIFCLGNMTNAI